MVVIELALLLVSVILFLLAAGAWVEAGRWSFGWLGLFFFALAALVPKLAPNL